MPKSKISYRRKVDWYGKNKNEERVHHASGWTYHAGAEDEHAPVHDSAQVAVFPSAAGGIVFHPEA